MSTNIKEFHKKLHIPIELTDIKTILNVQKKNFKIHYGDH